MTTTPLPAIPADAASDDFVRCLHCEYSLRGLGREGNCPECGTPIAPSWTKHELEQSHGWTPLRLASTSFLRRMGWCCALIAASAVITVLSQLLRIFVRPPPVFAQAIWLVSLALMGVGLWLLGSAEPSARRRQTMLRYVIRAGAIFDISWQAVYPMLLLRLLLGLTWYGSSAFDSVCVLVITWAVLHRLAQLLNRSDAPRGWGRLAGLLSWTWPPALLIQSLFIPYLMFAPQHHWHIMSRPVVAAMSAGVVLAHSLVTQPRFEPTHVFWGLMTAMSVATAVLLIRSSVVFFSVAKRDRRGSGKDD